MTPIDGGNLSIQQTDRQFMGAAIALAQAGLGRVWPNPSVGALITQGEGALIRVVGQGATAPAGGSHAEIYALAQAGAQAKGATCYVTLEPCAHFGRTPPCIDALIKARIGRVVIGMRDPNPLVAGQGIAALRRADIKVDFGIGEADCRDLTAGHIMRFRQGRPYIVLKQALSQEGAIGVRGQGAVAITGEQSRQFVHRLRAQMDAILVGAGTAYADNPRLTCRIKGWEQRSPLRVIVDTQARLSRSSALFEDSRKTPLWLLVANNAPRLRTASLQRGGAEIMRLPAESNGLLAPLQILRCLASRGITRLLIEGGASITRSFLSAGLVDEILLLTSPKHLSAKYGARLLVRPFSAKPEQILQNLGYRPVMQKQIGADRLVRYLGANLL